MAKMVLWWGHFDPEYSRNRIIRRVLRELGWAIRDFYPRISSFAYMEALSKKLHATNFDLVWVPCFRQRDIAQASMWAKRHNIPLLFDPLISAFDKQVNERGKFPADSKRARRLLEWEMKCFARADCVLADTPSHAEYFQAQFKVDKEKIFVVPVGAEGALFSPKKENCTRVDGPLEVLFFGSFISLQGPQVIAEAIQLYEGAPVIWRFIGEGPLLDECKALVQDNKKVTFDPWLPLEKLPEAIQRADILLGVFGTSDKAARVIPNKVFQSLACGKPVITRQASSYPDGLLRIDSGIQWVPPGDPFALAEAVASLAAKPSELEKLGQMSRRSYDEFLSEEVVKNQMVEALESLFAPS